MSTATPTVPRSYALDAWHDGTGPRTPLLDASTGEPVALLPASGPDPAEMLAYARNVEIGRAHV